jgi:hypothetical protein
VKAAARHWRTREWLVLVVLLAVAALARPGALRAPFFADDWLFLDQARARSLFATLAAPDPIGNFARPIGRQTWFWLMGHLSGESSAFFHYAALAVFVTAVGLLFRLGWRLGGLAVGTFAAAFFAFHGSADVPLTWASGSQDLLAVTFGVASVLLFLEGERGWAAALLLLGLLSKETIALAPLAALVLAREPGESWRRSIARAWPYAVAWALWLGVIAIAAARGRAHLGGQPFHFIYLLSALVNLVRTGMGLEWRTGSPPWIPFQWPRAWLWFLILVAAIVVGWTAVAETRPAAASRSKPKGAGAKPQERGRRARAETPRPDASRADSPRADSPRAEALRHSRRTLAWGGWTWALVAGAPVAIVAPIWSAYFYLFAMAGVGLGLGVWLAGRRWLAPLAFVFLALGTHQARMLDEFATRASPWSRASHVNNLYLVRGMAIISEGLADMKQLYPSLPPSSTVFLAGFPAFAAFQVGDGPLMRGAYRDTSLRAYYLSEFTEARATRGPVYFIYYDRKTGKLKDQTGDPAMLLRIAIGETMSMHPRVSEVALGLRLKSNPNELVSQYLSALVSVELGKSARADSFFAAAGLHHEGPADAVIQKARPMVARGDTVAAIQSLIDARIRHVRDARLHVELARLFSNRDDTRTDSVIESYAARVLDPQLAAAWRWWALSELGAERGLEARAAFERYFALEPAAATADTEATRRYEHLLRELPGGDLAQQALRRNVVR